MKIHIKLVTLYYFGISAFQIVVSHLTNTGPYFLALWIVFVGSLSLQVIGHLLNFSRLFVLYLLHLHGPDEFPK